MSISQILPLIPQALWESVYMTVLSTLFAYIIGMPLGLILVVTGKDGIRPMPGLKLTL